MLAALATLALTTTAIAALALAAVVLYRASLKRRPDTGCRSCEGTGACLSRLFASSDGYCPDCTGTGRRLRRGAHLLNVR
ncbi:hypothetical protein [Nonomuraea longicatena]|uniref:FeoB-associated Cys-rich membrane protein n=1 Tax=Nonomuraea longicatena TaxID=83682 RepID=A0ABN1PS28_9ACTN